MRLRGGVVHIRWLGESCSKSPKVTLAPLLQSMVPKLRDRKVLLDFQELAFMNSASVTPIMSFIEALAGVAVRVSVHYDQSLQWQTTSFRAMRVVARKWKNVEVIGEKAR